MDIYLNHDTVKPNYRYQQNRQTKISIKEPA